MRSHGRHQHMQTVSPDGNSLACLLGGTMAETSIRVRARRRCAMKPMVAVLGLVGLVGLAVTPGAAVAQIAKNVAAKSPWGPADEIGTLNMMTDASRTDTLNQVVGVSVDGLGVDLSV